MDATVIDDLKQFIQATVSQEVSAVRDEVAELRTEVRALTDTTTEIDRKVDVVQDTLADAISDIHDQLADHEVRLTRLGEHKAAA